MSARWTHVVSVLLLVVGGLALSVGAVAGYANRTVLDTNSFAAHIDRLRKQPVVRDAASEQLTTAVLNANPDLVAVRPLIEQASRSVMQSDALSPLVRQAAAQFQKSMTTSNSRQVVLRIADASAVLLALLPQLSPAVGDRIPAGVSVTLARAGSQSFAADVLRLARFVRLLAWLAPTVALACFAIVYVLGWQWRRALQWIGVTVACSGALIGLLLVAARLVLTRADTTTTSGAVLSASWPIFIRPLWTTVAVLVAAGILIGVAASADLSDGGLSGLLRRLLERARSRPSSAPQRLVRAAVLAGAAVALVLEPRAALTLVVAVGGLLLLVYAVSEIAESGAEIVRHRDLRRTPAPERRRLARVVPGTVVVLVVAVLGAAGLWQAFGPSTAAAEASGPVRGEGRVCNGHAALCSRRYNNVTFAATHNSMSAANLPGWFIPEQPNSLVPQLNAGIRALLFDVYLGQRAGGLVATVNPSPEAVAQLSEAVGPEVVNAAIRLTNQLRGTPRGPVEPYLCHQLCEIGATKLVPELQGVRSWLALNPDEVVTFIVENGTSPAVVGRAIEDAGLEPYVFTPPARGTPWPTLRTMIRSGKRLVVMVERGDGGQQRPWLKNAFRLTQDTSFTVPRLSDFNCAPNRGPSDAPLLLMNHWLTGFSDLVSAAKRANPEPVLQRQVDACEQERSKRPNFIAVNFYDIGALFEVVNRLNGVG